MQSGLKNVVLGVVLMATFALVWLVLIPHGVQVPKNIKIAALSPDFWPRIVTAGMVLLGAAVSVSGVFHQRRHGVATVAPSDDEKRARRMAAAKIIAAMVLLLAYYALVPLLGMVVASMLALPAFAAMYGERRWTILAPLAVLLPVAMYFFFTRVAGIPMPLGLFE